MTWGKHTTDCGVLYPTKNISVKNHIIGVGKQIEKIALLLNVPVDTMANMLQTWWEG